MIKEKVYRQADFKLTEGLLESYHIARQDVKLDACVIAVGRFICVGSEQTRLTPERMYPAVVHALQTHAVLSVRVARTNASTGAPYVLERLETVDLEKVVRFLDGLEGEEEDLAKVIQDEFTRPIDGSGSDGPLWRLTITPRNTVIFAWNHCIGDGQSGFAFLRTLLEGLNSTTESSDASEAIVHSVKIPQDLQLTPPLEELTDLSISFRTFVSIIAKLFVPRSWTSARVTWTGNSVASTGGNFSTRARLISIPSESIARLLAAARQHNTTLTAVLYLLGVSVLSELVSSSNAKARKKYKRISVNVPISLRPLSNVPRTAMGEFVSTCHTTEPLSPHPGNAPKPKPEVSTFDWSRAEAFSRRLHASIPRSREVIGSIKLLRGKYEAFHREKLGKKREDSLELSNIGAFQTLWDSTSSSTSSNQWTIGDAYFSQDDGTPGAALKMNCIGSPSGSVNISVTWGDGAVEDGFAEQFVHKLSNAIKDLDSEAMGDDEVKAD